MNLTHRIKREARFVVSMLVIGSLAGTVYAIVRDWTFSLSSGLRGGTTGFFIALACAAIEFSIFQRLTRLAFAALLFSRTIAVCKDSQRELIVSEEVLQRTAFRERYIFERMPDGALKGRQEKVPLYAVTVKTIDHPNSTISTNSAPSL